MKHASYRRRGTASCARGLAQLMICTALGVTPALAAEGARAPANLAGAQFDTQPGALPVLLIATVLVLLGCAVSAPAKETFH
ncbi:hypothetical protein [Duganella vulcania]|uniref:Uncharacterized protein n=1 Tax=Duganella vulcania TaxID=2692166 RepID=A0A845GHS3_9BURK|nr:hypothetical protein [Duganella vulcania]MYM94133.1 hypothetical protein [Duganella vulcania]